MKKIVNILVFLFLLISMMGCSSKSSKEINDLFSNLTDNYSFIKLNSINKNVQFMFEEYRYGEITYSEDIGNTFVDLDKEIETNIILFSSEGTVNRKIVSRDIDGKSTSYHKGMVDNFSNKLEKNAYIIAISSYSIKQPLNSKIPESIDNIDEFELLRLIRMNVIEENGNLT